MMLRAVVLAMGAMAMVACAATTEDVGIGDGEVVGIDDLDVLEKQLDLKVDTKDATGHYRRTDATVKAGRCYQSTVGSNAGKNFRFRRYETGAAFFRKKGTTPGTGDDRPIVCVDLDARDLDSGEVYNAEIERFEIDAIIRYHLGKEQGTQYAVGSDFTKFERGYVQAYFSEGPFDTDTLDRPLFQGEPLVLISVGNEPGRFVSASIASLVYRYAWRSAKDADLYTLSDDPVGKFVSVENGPDRTIAHYDRLDAYDIVTKAAVGVVGVETLIVAPKLSADDPAAHAVVTCTRPVDRQGRATGTYACTGL